MDSTRLTCPDCKSVLKPTKPVPFGKQIKCPKCGNPFFAPGLVEDQQEPPRKKAPGKKAKAGVKKSTGIKKAAGSKPSTKKPIHDDDDEGGIYGFAGAKEEEKPDIEYAPDMSIKDLRGPAQELVVKPSNYMILICGVCCLANIFLICFEFWPMIFLPSVLGSDWQKVLSTHYKDDKASLTRIDSYKEYSELKDKDLEIVQEEEAKEYKERFIYMGVFIFLFVYNCIAMVGAVKMQNLESRRWGFVASIMMLFPMGAGGIGYLIYMIFTKTIGGWVLDELAPYYGAGLGALPYLFALYVAATALKILMRQEVIDGYQYIAD